MQAIRFLPTRVHGVLDYLVGIALILAPNIFQFSEVGGAAVFVPRVLGAVLILYSLVTRYEWGILKLVPMSYHLMVDFAASVLLAASPFIFGFFSLKPNAWAPHVAVGLIVILVVLVSQTRPGRSTTTPVVTSQ
jgi:hypothetical protein